ncbi:MAG: YwqG family protein [Nocardioides sp.]
MTARTLDQLTRLARTHLDASAQRWLGLLRPAVQLHPAAAGDPVLARLGGRPELPADTAWPQWPGLGPLALIAEVDLAALTQTALDPGLVLPRQGRLLAFYFDDPDGVGAVVHSGDPDSLPGSRLLHVTGTGPAADPAVELTGVQVLTWPDREHPVLADAGLDDPPDSFDAALDELVEAELGLDVWGHQLGGWAMPVQGTVEYEAAETRLGEGRYDAAHTAEALRWRPLLQIDSDDAAGTSWGDEGCLYWLTRTDDDGVAGIHDVAFTWQCG